MTEADLKQYFDKLATQSVDIKHDPAAKKKSFFYIDNPFDLQAIENALRNTIQVPALLLDVPEIKPDSNGSTNYTVSMDCTFSIVTKAKGTDAIEAARTQCYQIGMKFLSTMHADSRKGTMIPGKRAYFRINEDQCNVGLSPIGPMAIDFYGWLFSFRIVCPFSITVNSGDWQDLS